MGMIIHFESHMVSSRDAPRRLNSLADTIYAESPAAFDGGYLWFTRA